MINQTCQAFLKILESSETRLQYAVHNEETIGSLNISPTAGRWRDSLTIWYLPRSVMVEEALVRILDDGL
jgi:hypothetical protein